ncbi:hypothetical protein V9T40_003927 [Parthenolecanium corni]|uniref:Uncharacterized protein n=1 Tax=Parthenolecanium corni TaxID=536013 RepID=A0AAN9TI18_9HEMI
MKICYQKNLVYVLPKALCASVRGKIMRRVVVNIEGNVGLTKFYIALMDDCPYTITRELETLQKKIDDKKMLNVSIILMSNFNIQMGIDIINTNGVGEMIIVWTIIGAILPWIIHSLGITRDIAVLAASLFDIVDGKTKTKDLEMTLEIVSKFCTSLASETVASFFSATMQYVLVKCGVEEHESNLYNSTCLCLREALKQPEIDEHNCEAICKNLVSWDKILFFECTLEVLMKHRFNPSKWTWFLQLLDRIQVSADIISVIEWLSHSCKMSKISEKHKQLFIKGIIASRRNKYLQKLLSWSNVVQKL